CQRQAYGLCHRDAGLLLSLVRARTEVRRDDDGLVGEERAVGSWLLGEDIDPCTGNSAFIEGDRKRRLVDDPAAGSVDDANGRLDLLECLFTNQAQGLWGLGEVHRDEVRRREQLVK